MFYNLCAPLLEQIVDWSEKLKRQHEGMFPPFNPNELVRVKGFIEWDKEGLRFHADSDGRIADNFYLANSVEPEKTKKYHGLPLELIVRILHFKDREPQISNIQNYDAGLIDITSLPLINPTPDEIASDSNTQAVIFGEFLGFLESAQDRFLKALGFPEGTMIQGSSSISSNGITRVHLSLSMMDGEKKSVDVVNPPIDYNNRETQALIKSEDGRTLIVHMPTGKAEFSGGVIENINGKHPQEGDVIRISTRVMKKAFWANWCDPCYLLEPSNERLLRYQRLASSIDHDFNRVIGNIDQGNYAVARILLAEVRAKEALEPQLERTYELSQRIPEPQRPVLTSKDEYSRTRDQNYLVKAIDQAYGVRLESMTAMEFTAFTKEALSGEREQTGEESDATYLFRMAPHMGFDKDWIEAMCLHVINGRIRRMKSKETPTFSDKYILDETIKELFYRKTPNSVTIISDTVRRLQEANIKIPYGVKSCFDRLVQHLHRGIEEGEDQQSLIEEPPLPVP